MITCVLFVLKQLGHKQIFNRFQLMYFYPFLMWDNAFIILNYLSMYRVNKLTCNALKVRACVWRNIFPNTVSANLVYFDYTLSNNRRLYSSSTRDHRRRLNDLTYVSFDF